MKRLLILLILLNVSYLTFAQTDLDDNYMELRLLGSKGWHFRTSPNTFFQPMGFFGQRIKPYLQEDVLAYQSFKKYRTNLVGTIGGAMCLGASLAITFDGFAEQNNQLATLGVGGILISGGILYFTQNLSLKHLQTSIDLYNRSKNPTLTHFKRFIPSISTSRHNLGIELIWNIY